MDDLSDVQPEVVVGLALLSAQGGHIGTLVAHRAWTTLSLKDLCRGHGRVRVRDSGQDRIHNLENGRLDPRGASVDHAGHQMTCLDGRGGVLAAVSS